MSSFRFSPSRSVILKEACSVPRRSAIPVASNCSDSGFRTENLSEELPLLITSMSEEEVGTERRLTELNPLSQSYAVRVGEASSLCFFGKRAKRCACAKPQQTETVRLHPKAFGGAPTPDSKSSPQFSRSVRWTPCTDVRQRSG